MSYWRLRVDDPTFGLNRGDVLEGEPYWLDPGGPGNPEGKVTIVRRLRDGYRPACSMTWLHLDELSAADAAVRQALLEGTTAMNRDPQPEAKPRIVVLAASASDAQREIAELGLGQLFTPYYVSIPHGVRGARQFIVLDSFAERVANAQVAAEWEEMLALLRASSHIREYTVDEVRRAVEAKHA